MITNQFALRHLVNGEPLPTDLNHRSSANTKLYDESINNRHWLSAKKAAGGRACVTADYNGTDTKNVSTLILGHFCPPDMNGDKRGYGVLSTYETGMNPDNDGETKICYNSYPTNESTGRVYRDIATVISNRYGLSLQDAKACSMELCAWADILPVIMPCDAADPSKDNSDYWQMREKTDVHSMAYIQYVIEELLKYVEVIIAVGDHSFNFVETMIEEGFIDMGKVTFLQHSPVAHPTKLLKFGPTIRQRHWLYQTITDMLTHILRQNRVNITREEAMLLCEHRTNDNNDTHGNFVLFGYFGGKRIIIGRSHSHFAELIREAYVSASAFPTTFRTLLETDERSGDVDGLEVKVVWYTEFNEELMKYRHRELQFGYQFPLESDIMIEWKMAAIAKQEERLEKNATKKRNADRNDAARSVRDHRADFDVLLRNIENEAEIHE
ncbi:hypothetical protein ACHAWC_009873 [Mediolabrus comicus]